MRWGNWEEPLAPHPVGICGSKGIATSALEHTAQTFLDSILAITRIGSKQQEIFSEVSGVGHRRAEERHVPQRRSCFVYRRHDAGQVSGISEGRSEGHIGGAPSPQPRANHDAFGNLWRKVLFELLPWHLAELSSGEHHARREDVLPQPPVLEGAYPQTVLGKPAPDRGARCARWIDDETSPPGS